MAHGEEMETSEYFVLAALHLDAHQRFHIVVPCGSSNLWLLYLTTLNFAMFYISTPIFLFKAVNFCPESN